MKFICIISLVVILLDSQLVEAKQWYHDVKATSLTPQTFDTLVGNKFNVAIEFFTPWCGYCQQMSPEWNRLFEHYEENQNTRKDVKITKVNCDEHMDFCRTQAVQSFPQIKFYKAGGRVETSVFRGYRRFQDFQQWIEDNSGPAPPSTQTESGEALNQPNEHQKDQNLSDHERIEKEEAAAREAVLKRHREVEEEIRRREAEIEAVRREQLEIIARNEAIRQEEEKKSLEAEHLAIKEELIKAHQEIERLRNSTSIDSETKVPTHSTENEMIPEIDLEIKQIYSHVEATQRQIGAINTMLKNLSVNVDYITKKIEIVESQQTANAKATTDLSLTIQTISHGSKEMQSEIQKLSEHSAAAAKPTVHLGSHPQPGNIQKESYLTLLVFLVLGMALGYLFSFIVSRRSKSSESDRTSLPLQNQTQKSN